MKIRPKIKIKWIILLVLILILAFPLVANAQSVTGQMSSAFTDILSKLAEFLAVLLKVLQRILWPIFLAIGGLLNNDILFGYGMEQRLLEVWVIIRNIVNVIFVVVLLGVALFNVLAFKPDSEFALKSFLPKFAIALIAVNFSYIGMKIILDVANVATTAVFTLPSSISEEVANPQLVTCTDATVGSCTVKNDKIVEKICNAYYGSAKEYNKMIESLPEKDLAAIRPSLICKSEGDKLTLSPKGMEFFRRYNSRNAGLVMAIQFMNVMDVDNLSSNISKDKVKIDGLAFNLLFSVILYIVYGAAYVALFIVLLTRLVVLWLFIALSPFVALSLVMPNLMPEAGGDIQKKFFKNAFAPVLMGIPLTIGYVILEAFRKADNTGDVGLGTAFNMVKLETSGISDLQSMIIAFAAVAVVWVGVFAAAEGTIAGQFTEQIKQKVAGLGMTALKGLKMLPIIPAGQGGKGLSYYQAMDKTRAPWGDLMKRYGPSSLAAGKMNVNQIKNIAKKTTSTQEEGRKAVLGGLDTRGGQKEAYKLLKTWSGRNAYPKQQRFAKGVLAGLSADQRKRFEKGKLEGFDKTKLRGLRIMQGGTAPSAPPRNTGPNKPGVKPTVGGTTAGTQGPNTDINAISTAEGYGVTASAGLAATRQKWRAARQSGDKVAQKKAETELQTTYKDEINKMKNTSKSGIELQGVTTSVGAIKDVAKPDAKAVDALSKKLRTADASLKKNKVGDADRKKILGQVLQKATGGKSAELLKDAKISKYAS